MPPLTTAKKIATAKTMIASVVSHPARSCSAGSENRKNVSGRPKIGSTADASGAPRPYQASASVVQSASIPRPDDPRDDQRGDEADQAQDRFDREAERLAVDEESGSRAPRAGPV